MIVADTMSTMAVVAAKSAARVARPASGSTWLIWYRGLAAEANEEWRLAREDRGPAKWRRAARVSKRRRGVEKEAIRRHRRGALHLCQAWRRSVKFWL